MMPKSLQRTRRSASGRIIPFIFALGLVAGCAGTGGSRTPQGRWHSDKPVSISTDDRQVLQDASGFKEISAKAKLPPAVVALCTDKTGKLAEPGKRWNSGCVINPDLASNRLIWAATNDDYYVVHYEWGGFVGSAHVLIVRFNGDAAGTKVVWRGSGWWLKNYEDFLDALQTRRLEDEREYVR